MLLFPMLLFSAVETCAGSLGPATSALQQKDPAKALALLDPLRGQCSRSSTFYELLGLASELSGKGPAAEEALRMAVSLDPNSPRLLTELGATYLQNGNPGEAAKVLDKALALDPSNTTTMKYAVGAAVQSGAWQRAGTLFHQLDADDHPEALQEEPILVLWYARTLIETHRSDRIKTLLSPRRKLMSPGLLFSLGTMFAEHQMYEYAVDYFRQVPTLAADEALYFNLGLSYSHLKKFDKARKCYFQAIDKHSEHADAYLHVGLDYVVSGDSRMGIPWLWRAHRLAPDRPDISYALVEQFISLGYVDTAKEVLFDAISGHPHDALLDVANGDLKRANGDTPGAAESYEKALAEKPGLTPGLVGLARVNIAQGKDSEAQSLLRMALSGDPEDAFANGELGLLEDQHGDWDAALGHLSRAWAQDRSNTRIAFALARAYRHKQRDSEALQLLISLRPTLQESAAFHFELAQVYADLHRPADAQTERETFSRLQANTHEGLHFDSPRIYVH
jgi:tetratricopeptide (TPR) repeat protein